MKATNNVLFLCTGNYYRSRFAEELFNDRALAAGLAWRATSRGLAVSEGAGQANVGPLSLVAFYALVDRGVAVAGWERYPQQCTTDELKAASVIVALQEMEHRPLLAERFGGWEERVVFWHVRDVEFEAPATALAAVESNIETLMRQLRAVPILPRVDVG